MGENAKPGSSAIRINLSNPTLLLVPVCASTFGFVSGLLTSSQKASLQFLAENAHRQPSTLQGWYFYNKTKNYRVALAGLKGGLSTAARLGGWTAGFVAVQEAASIGLGVGEAQGGAVSGTILAVAASALCERIAKLSSLDFHATANAQICNDRPPAS